MVSPTHLLSVVFLIISTFPTQKGCASSVHADMKLDMGEQLGKSLLEQTADVTGQQAAGPQLPGLTSKESQAVQNAFDALVLAEKEGFAAGRLQGLKECGKA